MKKRGGLTGAGGLGGEGGGIAVGVVWILFLFYREGLFAFPQSTLRNFGVYIQIHVESIAITSFN